MKKNIEKATTSVRLNSRLFNRIESHVHKLRHLISPGINKQFWVTEAILEKIALKEKAYTPELKEEKSLPLYLSKHLSEQLNEVISCSRKSKKEWISEAIEQKLNQEEKRVDKSYKEIIEKTQN